MESGKINYAGVIGAVAGVVGLWGIYAGWFAYGNVSADGTVDVSGKVALAFSIATFVFAGGYLLMSDFAIRRAMGALMTICSVVLTLACVWGVTRADQVAAGGTSDTGLLVSGLGGVLGICAGLLALQSSMKADEGGSQMSEMQGASETKSE